MRDVPALREVDRPLDGRASDPGGRRPRLDRDGSLGRRGGLDADRAGAGGHLTRLETLLAAQRGLRIRLDDFRSALERGDEDATLGAIAELDVRLRRLTDAERRALLPALLRAGVPGRDAKRELTLQWTQVVELTRHVLAQVTARAPRSDILGFAENLSRRLEAHASEMERVYYPAAEPALTPEEWSLLAGAAKP